MQPPLMGFGNLKRMIRAHRCPVCDCEFSRPDTSQEDQFPFCSDRCRKVDLFRWWEGRYEIVEDVDPMVAQFLKDDPDVKVQVEGAFGQARLGFAAGTESSAKSWLENEHGVYIELVGEQTGLMLASGGDVLYFDLD